MIYFKHTTHRLNNITNFLYEVSCLGKACLSRRHTSVWHSAWSETQPRKPYGRSAATRLIRGDCWRAAELATTSCLPFAMKTCGGRVEGSFSRLKKKDCTCDRGKELRLVYKFGMRVLSRGALFARVLLFRWFTRLPTQHDNRLRGHLGSDLDASLSHYYYYHLSENKQSNVKENGAGGIRSWAW
jgi:hypothetical protein